jgi:hypothetical protein
MNTKNTFFTLCLLFAAFLIYCGASNSNDQRTQGVVGNDNAEETQLSDVLTTDSLKIIAQKSYKNLQIFMIAGEPEITDKNYVILGEALKNKYAVIKETGSVNELSVKNLSKHYIFIHSGDIVKGGQQDRTLSFDVIVPPKAKGVPLASFCVEHNRWHQRGNEAVGNFAENKALISSRKLKVASKGMGNQGQVWSEVSDQQSKLNQNVSYMADKEVDITENESSSSLQLSLENEDLDSIRNSFKEHFELLLKKYPEAIGFAYAINGEVYGIELYNNKKLFDDQWNKLLDATIVESVSEMVKDSIFEPATSKNVNELMAKALVGKKDEKDINSETNCYIFKQKEAMLFTTIDKGINKWVHKNYIAVDTTMTAEQPIRQQQILNNENIIINQDDNR